MRRGTRVSYKKHADEPAGGCCAPQKLSGSLWCRYEEAGVTPFLHLGLAPSTIGITGHFVEGPSLGGLVLCGIGRDWAATNTWLVSPSFASNPNALALLSPGSPRGCLSPC